MYDNNNEQAKARPLRLFYAAGPGDVIGTYRHWREGCDDPSQVAVTYSGQFYDVCRDLGAEALVISSHPRAEVLEDGPIRIEHRPGPPGNLGGLRYHQAQARRTLGLVREALRFRADAAIFAALDNWFLLAPLPMLGVPVVPTMHCVLWPKHKPPKGPQRILARLNQRLFRKSAAILSLSHDISRQLTTADSRVADKIIMFRPTYRPSQFVNRNPPEAPPYRVLYAGRVERNKGVFDLLEVARILLADGNLAIEFDLCGDGGAFQELQAQAQEAGLSDRFRLHGNCERQKMLDMYKHCHAVIVPTTTDFIEGFNKVVAEGVLSGRPVITSSVCPALDYVREAVVEVPPDDVPAYAGAIRRLASDPGLYCSMRSACATMRGQFLDEGQGWGAALSKAIGRCMPDRLRPPSSAAGKEAGVGLHSSGFPQ